MCLLPNAAFPRGPSYPMISSGRRAEAMWIADGAPRWNILRAPTMSPPLSTPRQRRLPILAGATRGARVLACLGALIGIGLTGLVSAIAAGRGANIPFIVGPIGASAILLFAVPASPLAQPWNIIGGNTISAVVGVIVSRLIHDPMLAAPLAVALAIGAMSLTRSLHPPGGATALTAVVGGAATASAGFMFPLIPVALNCFVLVGVGWVFHRISGQAYPHAPAMGPQHLSPWWIRPLPRR